MKKTISVILSLFIICGLFASCGTQQTESAGGLKIIATVFPEYDWVKNILGEKAESAVSARAGSRPAGHRRGVALCPAGKVDPV